MNDWQKTIQSTKSALVTIDQAIADLTKYRDATTAEIAQYLRIDDGIELDYDAIRATATRPYTILPINEHEAWLIHWRGIKMPIFGWVVAQEPAFIKAKVTRSMDLLTPFPMWMKSDLGWKDPEHAAIIDGTRTSINLTEGDEATFRRRYGKHLGSRQADGSIKIKSGDAWIKLVASLVRDGILPYAPTAVADELWNEEAIYPKLLFDLIAKKEKDASDTYIHRAIDEFRNKGAILANLPPGSGKTLLACAILNHFIGRVLILGDSTTLIEQWRDRVQVLAAGSTVDVTISTYQGAGKYLNEEWDLIIFDEAQRLPANTFSKLAFVKTKYRIGQTGTPWREDDRQHLIVALSGFPVTIRWSQLIKAGVLRRPRIMVATVANEQAKTAYVKSLIAKRKGKAIIFCDWIQQGQQLADALDVPFVHGSTSRKLQKILESDVCVVSRVGDRGISLPDLRLVIEVAGAGIAREQFAQRVGRLLHGEFEGEFITVFTPEEAAKYRGRVFGVEAELAGEVDIEFITVGNVTEVQPRGRQRPSAPVKSQKAKTQKALDPAITNPLDEISATLTVLGVAAKIKRAKESSEQSVAANIEKVLRYCWDVPLSPTEIFEGLGLTGARTLSRISMACKAASNAGLMVLEPDGRYRVNKDELNRLKKLSELRKK